MTRRLCLSLVCLLIWVGVGCGGDDDGGSISPSSVSKSDLYGYWVADPLPEENAEQRRIFAFVSPDDADYELPLAENELSSMGEAVGAVYLAATAWYPSEIQQITSYDVSDGSILQTVLADYNAEPGMMYATAIKRFERGTSMVLESDSSPTGEREFRFYERCPANTPTGWYRYRGQACNSYVSTGTALAIDAEGGVHAMSGVGEGQDPYCPPAPTFTDIHPRGCTARHSETPNTRGATSMMISGDIVREVVVIETSGSPASYANNRDKLFLRERALDGAEWTERKISDEILNVAEVRLLERDGAPLIVAEGVLEIVTFSDNGTSFDKRALQLGEDALDGRLIDAVLTPDAELVIAVDRLPSIYKESGDAFEAIDAPEGLGLRAALDVHVDEQGRIHAVFAGADVAGGPGTGVIGRSATYAIHDGDSWTTYPLGLIERAYIVSQGDALQVVALTEKAARSALALLTIGQDGVVTSELISDEPSFGAGNSAETFVDPAAAIGPDGTIAATFDGSMIWVKHPDAPFEPKPIDVEFRFNGEGSAHITSSDGSVDCTETCTFESHVGARYFVQAESSPGTEALLGWCPLIHQTLFGGCWAEVRPTNDPNNPAGPATFIIAATPSAIHDRLLVSDALNRNAMVFDTRGEDVALGLAFNPGYSDFPIDGQLLDVDDGDTTQVGGVAIYNRQTQQGVAVKLPVTPTDVAMRADGGAQFVLQLAFQYELDGAMVGPGTVFGTVSAQGAIEARTVDAQVVAAIVDGQREIALVRDYMGAPHALLIDDEAVPLDDVMTPVASAMLHADGDDVIVYIADRLVRVRGTVATLSEPLVNVSFTALSVADGRVVGLHQAQGTEPDFGAGTVSNGNYIVEYRDDFTLHAAELLPPLMLAAPGDTGNHLAITNNGATLITSNNYYELNADLETQHQTTFEPSLGDIVDSKPTEDGIQLLTLNALLTLGPPAR